VPIDSLRLVSDRRLAMLSAGLFILPTLWYVRTDLALYGADWPHLQQRLASRVLALAGSALAIVASARHAHAPATICAYPPEGATLPLRTPLFTLFVLYGTLHSGFWRQCTPAWLLGAGLILLRLTWLTSGAGADIGGDVVIILIVNAFGTLLVKRRLTLEQDVNVAWQAEHAARLTSDRALAELRTLRGIIPTCSHCKKVRSDMGDWEQIESYVRAHSDAQFSHGICPQCYEIHYPDSAFRAAGRMRIDRDPSDSGSG
jgi:hypothetical protein